MSIRASRQARVGWKQLVAGLLIPALLALQLGGCGSPSDAEGQPVNPEASEDTVSTGSGGVYDGETIFKGTFFGMGPVAELVPEIWTNRDVNLIKAQLSGPNGSAKAQEAAANVEELARELRSSGYGEAAAAKARKIADDLLVLSKSPEELARLLDKAAADVRKGNVSAATAVAVNRTVAQIKAKDPAFFERFGAEMQSGNRLRISRALETAGREYARATLLDPAVGQAVSDRVELQPGQDVTGLMSKSPAPKTDSVFVDVDVEAATSGGGEGSVQWVNEVQVANVVQAVNFVQVHAVALFVVAAIVYIAAFAAAAFIAVPARSENLDPLQGDLLVNSLAVRLRPPSQWAAGRVYATGDFARFGNRIYQSTRAHTAHTGAEPNVADASLWQPVTP